MFQLLWLILGFVAGIFVSRRIKQTPLLPVSSTSTTITSESEKLK